MNTRKTAAPLVRRTAVFLCVFILLSGLIGPRMIGGGLMERGGFAIYGGLGKALLFAVLALALLIRHKATMPHLLPLKPAETAQWGSLTVMAFIGAWLCVNQLLAGSNSLVVVIAAHLLLIASVAGAAVACFGVGTIRLLIKTYYNQLTVSVYIAAGFYVFLELVYGMWRYLSFAVLHSVQFLLHMSNLHVEIIPPLTLLLDKFGVTIEQTCSGIESIALFTGLYVLVGLLDWQKLNHKRFVLLFPLALLILFGLNILRVYSLIMAGYYINPQIAFTLFHTYAGMVFFIIYSGIFWGLSYKWMLRRG